MRPDEQPADQHSKASTEPANECVDGCPQEAGRAIREACLEAVADGVRTADLGGHAGTTEFTDEVIRRTRSKLEVWASL